MEPLPFEFAELFQKAKELLASEKSAQQVIVVLTSQCHIYHFFNHNVMDTTAEKNFAAMLLGKNDTEIRRIICMWDGLIPDLPSMHLRQLLVRTNPLNKEAEILLQGNGTWLVRKLKDRL